MMHKTILALATALFCSVNVSAVPLDESAVVQDPLLTAKPQPSLSDTIRKASFGPEIRAELAMGGLLSGERKKFGTGFSPEPDHYTSTGFGFSAVWLWRSIGPEVRWTWTRENMSTAGYEPIATNSMHAISLGARWAAWLSHSGMYRYDLYSGWGWRKLTFDDEFLSFFNSSFNSSILRDQQITGSGWYLGMSFEVGTASHFPMEIGLRYSSDSPWLPIADEYLDGNTLALTLAIAFAP